MRFTLAIYAIYVNFILSAHLKNIFELWFAANPLKFTGNVNI